VARCLLSTQGAPGLKPLLHAGGKNPFSEIKKRRQRFPLWSERFGRQPGRATALSHGHEPQGRATRRAQLAPSPSALPSALTARFPRPALEMSAEAPRNRPRQLPKTLLGSSPLGSSPKPSSAAPQNAPRQPTPLQLPETTLGSSPKPSSAAHPPAAPRNCPQQLPKTLLGSSPKRSSAAPRNGPRQLTPRQLPETLLGSPPPCSSPLVGPSPTPDGRSRAPCGCSPARRNPPAAVGWDAASSSQKPNRGAGSSGTPPRALASGCGRAQAHELRREPPCRARVRREDHQRPSPLRRAPASPRSRQSYILISPTT